MNQPIKIIVADVHQMIGQALSEVLERMGKNQLTVVGVAYDCDACIDLMLKWEPDIIISGLPLDSEGDRLIEYCRGNERKEKIIVLTDNINRVEFEAALSKGISGCVLKSSTMDTLYIAVNKVYWEEIYIDNNINLLPMLTETEVPEALNTAFVLTKREIEILKLLTKGLFNKEIAYKLSISEKTVKNHISNIFKKIGVSDRTQAAVYAIKNGLVSL